jgi:hypothetical protein
VASAASPDPHALAASAASPDPHALVAWVNQVRPATLKNPELPRHGNFFSNFSIAWKKLSTPWKIFSTPWKFRISDGGQCKRNASKYADPFNAKGARGAKQCNAIALRRLRLLRLLHLLR